MKRILIYIFLLFLFSGCLSTQERRLLQIMEESEKLSEINDVKNLFEKNKCNLNKERRYQIIMLDSTIYAPEHFIFNPQKDTCIVVYSASIPFPIDIWTNREPSPCVAILKMVCENKNGKWDIITTKDVYYDKVGNDTLIYEYEDKARPKDTFIVHNAKEIPVDTIFEECIGAAFQIEYFYAYNSEKERIAYIRNRKKFAKSLIGGKLLFSSTDCGCGTRKDIEEMITRKYWFD